MLTPTIFVFERRPRWVPELERQFAGEEVRVRGCGRPRVIESRLARTGNGVVLMDVEANPAECLEVLERLMSRTPGQAVLVVATPSYRKLEWPIRELGAVTFLEEPVPGEEMAAHCRRQFRVH